MSGKVAVGVVGTVEEACGGGWLFIVEADGVEIERLLFDTKEEADRASADMRSMLKQAGARDAAVN